MTVALITGANSGIGRATAIDLAAHGYDVYASMRDLASGAKLAGLASEAGVEVRPVQLDVANDESVTAAVTHVVEHAGRIDVLVNNAGVGFNATTEDVDIDAAKEVFETNFWGALRCTKAVSPPHACPKRWPWSCRSARSRAALARSGRPSTQHRNGRSSR